MAAVADQVEPGRAAEIIEQLLVELAARHSAGDVEGDPREDLRIAGVSMYQLLTGEEPTAGHLALDDVPPAFARVCERLLAGAQGYPTAMDAANALRAAQVEAGTVGVAPGVWRRRFLVGVMIAAGLTIVGLRESRRRRSKRPPSDPPEK
jgi:hypothetical protein